jgi:hypothetical protein
MKSSQAGNQYTVRGVPDRVDAALRRRAREEGKSLNQVTVEALEAASGVAETPVLYHDLDSLAGSWRDDPEFDASLEAQDQVDPQVWQ